MTEAARRASALPDGVARALRVGGAATGLVGVALAATTTVWPTKILALRVPEVGDFTRGSEQWLWSWGRDVVHYVTHGLVLADDPGPQPVARLVLLVAVLVVAAVGLVTWLVVPGRRGEVCAGVGLGTAVGTVGSSVVQRVSFDDRTIGLQPGLVSVTTTAGWLEVVAVALLLVALGLLVVPLLLPGATSAAVVGVRRLTARTTQARVGVVRTPAGGAGAVPAPPRPRATLREVPGAGGDEGGTRPAVGFSDPPPDPGPPAAPRS
ncbi:hypothetical protein [Terrabacter sp. NPDC000476]|uniref:hypothetical protein n=1 Tax=Terrabacter sp. NPDC000476 TaxID=3154258 RepID=UPI0033179D33